jgi:hypothetical protein
MSARILAQSVGVNDLEVDEVDDPLALGDAWMQENRGSRQSCGPHDVRRLFSYLAGQRPRCQGIGQARSRRDLDSRAMISVTSAGSIRDAVQMAGL